MRLLVDAMCGRLARILRMCGHDAVYAPDRDLVADEAIAGAAAAADRLVITRDADLAAIADEALLLTATDIGGQLDAVRAAGIPLELGEPSRCGRCNGRLERVEETATTPPYAPDPAAEPVWRCADCGQCFWRGSHWEDVRARLAG